MNIGLQLQAEANKALWAETQAEWRQRDRQVAA